MSDVAENKNIAILLQEGFSHHQQGRLEEAERCYQNVLSQDSNHFDALHLMGIIALQIGRTAQGIGLIKRALAINPSVAAAFNNIGNGFKTLLCFDEALQNYDRALALDPNQTDTQNNRGRTLNVLGRFAEAEASFNAALALNPQSAEAYCGRATALREQKRTSEALADIDRALRLNPRFAEAYSNRGNLHNDLGLFMEALDDFKEALSLNPLFPETHVGQAKTLEELRRIPEALAAYDHALEIDSNHADARFNKSLCLLRAGNFAEGLPLHEARRDKRDKHGLRSFDAPLWLGEEKIAGKTLLLHAEQGFGDTIMFCRFAKDALNLGAKVILSVPQALVRLMESLDPRLAVVADQGPLPAFDIQCPLMSLPLAFKTRLETIPAPIPYLFAEKNRQLDTSSSRRRIGLCWSGNFRHANDVNRSLALEMLRPLIQETDALWIGLQKNVSPTDAATLATLPLQNWGPNFADFADAATAIDSLDVIVSVDTSIAHLAGALGKPTFILLPHYADWRWFHDRTDCPWYPQVRLFRQSQRGDWSAPLGKVRRELLESEAFIPTAKNINLIGISKTDEM